MPQILSPAALFTLPTAYANATVNTTNFIANHPANIQVASFAPMPKESVQAKLILNNVRAFLGTINPPEKKSVAIQAISFCMPANPVGTMYLMHAEVNLYKIRNCMNIAGIERVLDPFAAPTDTSSGLPYIGIGGNLVLPQNANFRPSQYRYDFLMERAKQLIGIAQQMEGSMLAAAEKYDSERYAQLQAKQQIKLTRESIKLSNLQVKRAEGEVDLANLQKDKADFQQQHFANLISEGLIGFELAQIQFMFESLEIQNTQTKLSAAVTIEEATKLGPGGKFSNISAVVQAGLGIVANSLQFNAQMSSLQATFARRTQEWQFQKDTASKDLGIAKQQVKQAETGVRIAGQELRIAELNEQNAQDTLEFLKDKFTSAELYGWMTGILEKVYSKFLQMATAVAIQAQNQLAFERQEVPPQFIKTDYWESPVNPGDQKAANRKGLTGSARLLQDIYSLDQYALDTNVRKMQMSKTISLANFDPLAFQLFRQTGVLNFSTSLQMFDRDFPGHYLRLIKQVKTSLIALIPPNEGIKATLSNVSTSRVVTKNGNQFQKIGITNKTNESVALTSPQNATGIFEMQANNAMLNPFEGMGVESQWTFEMYKAANLFDFETIADVLVTIDYTALTSAEYKAILVKEMDNTLDGNKSFSLKNNFPDQWYDLSNQINTNTAYKIDLNINRSDYSSALIEDPTFKGISLYFVRKNKDVGNDYTIKDFSYVNGSNTANGMGGKTNTDGLISSRLNTGWGVLNGKPAFGKLSLNFEQTGYFKNGDVADILLVINYESELPAFPLS